MSMYLIDLHHLSKEGYMDVEMGLISLLIGDYKNDNINVEVKEGYQVG